MRSGGIAERVIGTAYCAGCVCRPVASLTVFIVVVSVAVRDRQRVDQVRVPTRFLRRSVVCRLWRWRRG